MVPEIERVTSHGAIESSISNQANNYTVRCLPQENIIQYLPSNMCGDCNGLCLAACNRVLCGLSSENSAMCQENLWTDFHFTDQQSDVANMHFVIGRISHQREGIRGSCKVDLQFNVVQHEAFHIKNICK